MTTLLIVDDRRENMVSLAPRLEAKGFVVLTALNGKQAIEVANNESIDLILMDLNMPEMDGCEAAEKLKSEDKTKGIPIIACTAHSQGEDRQRALDSGCDAFLEKPLDFKTLLALMDKHLNNASEQPPLESLATTAEAEDSFYAEKDSDGPGNVP